MAKNKRQTAKKKLPSKTQNKPVKSKKPMSNAKIRSSRSSGQEKDKEGEAEVSPGPTEHSSADNDAALGFKTPPRSSRAVVVPVAIVGSFVRPFEKFSEWPRNSTGFYGRLLVSKESC